MLPRFCKLSLLSCLVLVMVACSTTPPSSYYRLTARESLPAGSSGPALGVGPVSIPQYLDRDGLVRSDGANALQIATSERWAEPLDQGITRVVSMNLAGLLQTQNVQLFPWHPDRRPDYGVKIRVLGMDANQEQASLVVEWLLHNVEPDSAVQRQLSEYHVPLSGTGAREISAAYSDLLYQLSKDVASAVSLGTGSES